MSLSKLELKREILALRAEREILYRELAEQKYRMNMLLCSAPGKETSDQIKRFIDLDQVAAAL